MLKLRHMIDGWGGSQSDAFAGGIEAAGLVGAASIQEPPHIPGTAAKPRPLPPGVSSHAHRPAVASAATTDAAADLWPSYQQWSRRSRTGSYISGVPSARPFRRQGINVILGLL